MLSKSPPQVLAIRQQDRVKDERPRELFDLLVDAGSCNCKDPRDRIFALLSMSNAEHRNGLMADYTMTTEQVYTKAATCFLEVHGLDVVFSAVEARAGDVSHTIPSWVPDWTTPQTCTPLTRLIPGRTPTQQRAPLPKSWSVSNAEGTTLRVRGHYVVTITDGLGPTCTPAEDFLNLERFDLDPSRLVVPSAFGTGSEFS